jgi:hypothetical protein
LRIALEQLLVLKPTIVTMNTTSKEILVNERKMKEVLENLALDVKLQDNKLNYEIDTSFVLNELIKKLREGLKNVNTHLTY